MLLLFKQKIKGIIIKRTKIYNALFVAVFHFSVSMLKCRVLCMCEYLCVCVLCSRNVLSKTCLCFYLCVCVCVGVTVCTMRLSRSCLLMQLVKYLYDPFYTLPCLNYEILQLLLGSLQSGKWFKKRIYCRVLNTLRRKVQGYYNSLCPRIFKNVILYLFILWIWEALTLNTEDI